MSHISDLKQKVADCEAALGKVNDQKNALVNEENDLQAQRRMACRGLAQGDSKQLKVIADLDSKIRPIQEKSEGCGLLINEAEQALTAAKADLQAAINEQDTALSEFLKTKNAEYKQTTKGTLNQLVQDILAALAAAEVKLGELNVASMETGGWPSDQLYGLHKSFVNFVEGSNLRMLMASGIPGTISLWPAIVNDADIQRSLPGGGPVSCKSVCDVRASLRQASWVEEFQNKAE